jgi:hypothetical protein
MSNEQIKDETSLEMTSVNVDLNLLEQSAESSDPTSVMKSHFVNKSTMISPGKFKNIAVRVTNICDEK